MSEISRELQEQHGNMGAVMRKLFPTAPAIDTEAQREIDRKAAQTRAEALLAHVRDLGDDY